MKKPNRLMLLNARLFYNAVSIAAALFVTSCITVNVNFPESAVERAADDFVHDLYKAPVVADNKTADQAEADKDAASIKGSMKKTGTKKKVKSPVSAPVEQPSQSTAPTTSHFDLSLMPSAFAAEINTQTPAANKIKASMATRVTALKKWQSLGVLCENGDGKVGILSARKAGSQALEVSDLIEAENHDREKLYKEIQEANRITDRDQIKIRKFFSAAFQKQGAPACN